jgi:hypothetical protein
MPERCRQDQKLVPFVAKVVEKVSKMLPRLLQGRPPTKPQILALSKYVQAGPGAYKLTAAMVKNRAAWDALSPKEQDLSNEQHDYDNHCRTHLAVYEEHHSWDIVDIANFARDRPQRHHIKPTTLMKAMMQQWYGAPTSPVMLRVLKVNELMRVAADDETSEVQWPVMGCEITLIDCPPFPDLPDGFDKKLHYCNALECTAPCAANMNQAACSPAHLLAIRVVSMLIPAPTSTPSATFNNYDTTTSFGAHPQPGPSGVQDEYRRMSMAASKENQAIMAQQGEIISSLIKGMDKAAVRAALTDILPGANKAISSKRDFMTVAPRYTFCELTTHLRTIALKPALRHQPRPKQTAALFARQETKLLSEIRSGAYTGPGSAQSLGAGGMDGASDLQGGENYCKELLRRFYKYRDNTFDTVEKAEDFCTRTRLWLDRP